MRKELLFLIMFLLLSVVLCATKKTDWQVMGLQGKVKSIIAERDTTLFGENGLLTSHVFWTQDGNSRNYLKNIDTYTYDSNFNLLSHEFVNGYGYSSSSTYTYDNSGLLTKHRGGTTYFYYTYNDKQQVTWRKKEDMSFRIVESIEYFYDESGKVAKENYYIWDMKFDESFLYTYDKTGNLLEKQTKDKNNQLTWKTVNKYNEQNLCIEECIYQVNELKYKKVLSYDDHGNIIKQIDTPSRFGVTKTTHEYEYDDKGNWIKHKEYYDDVLKKNESRTLTYFKD